MNNNTTTGGTGPDKLSPASASVLVSAILDSNSGMLPRDTSLPAEEYVGSQVCPAFSARVETSLDGLRRYQAQLQTLASEAAVANVFYEPWLLFPALENYAGTHKLIFLLIFARLPGGEADEAGLRGFFPMLDRPSYRWLPLRHLVLWRCDNSYLSTPLVHRAQVGGVLREALAWFRANRHYKLLLASQLSAEGPFHESLNQALEGAALPCLSDSYARAMLYPEADYESYLSKHVSSGLRKDMRRKARRLADQGVVEYQALAAGDDLESWLRQFVQLEAAGWKGSQGAAIENSAEARRFFWALARQAHEQGRLMMLALRLDQRVIAMQMNLLAGDGAFGFKTAYDEAYAMYSPGILLVLEMIRRVHEDPRRQLKWLDSCTDQGFSAFDKLFSGSKAMRNLLVSNKHPLATFLVGVLPLARRVNRRVVSRSPLPRRSA